MQSNVENPRGSYLTTDTNLQQKITLEATNMKMSTNTGKKASKTAKSQNIP